MEENKKLFTISYCQHCNRHKGVKEYCSSCSPERNEKAFFDDHYDHARAFDFVDKIPLLQREFIFKIMKGYAEKDRKETINKVIEIIENELFLETVHLDSPTAKELIEAIRKEFKE